MGACLPQPAVLLPSPALPAALQASAPEERTPTVPTSLCQSLCGADPSGCCTKAEYLHVAAPAPHRPSSPAPTEGLAAAPLAPNVTSPHRRGPQEEGPTNEERQRKELV